MRALPDKKTGK